VITWNCLTWKVKIANKLILDSVQFCTTNHNELKKIWVDFVENSLHLNDSYIKWICMMEIQFELNSNTSNGIQIELNSIILNPNLIQIEFNQIMKN
jgi:hypothetical protein